MSAPTGDDRLLFHDLIPSDVSQPIDVYQQSAALQLAVVERNSARFLSNEWDAPGVYVLLDRHAADDTWGAYVGKAPAGISTRIKNHLTHKDHWYRAVLIKRDTTYGFNSAHTAWLEGRIFDLLEASAEANLHNAQRPGDDTLAAYDLPMLEAAIAPIASLLRLIGHDPATAEEQGVQPSRHTKNIFHGVSLSDLISAGFLKGDEGLVSSWASYPVVAQLHPDGRVQYDGKMYASLSAAGATARGGSANGWDFWAVPTPTGKVRLATYRARFQAKKD